MRRFGLVFDVIAVVTFVAIGRSTHDDGVSLPGMVSTLWPFLTGLVTGWIVVMKFHREPQSVAGGIAVLMSTVIIGTALRVVGGQGTAFAFIVLTIGFLGATMLAWRLLFSKNKLTRISSHTH